MYLRSLEVTCGKKKHVLELMEPLPDGCGSLIYKKSSTLAEIALYELSVRKKRYFVATYTEGGTRLVVGISDSAEEARLYAMGKVLSLKLDELEAVRRKLGEDASVITVGIAAEIEELIDIFDEMKSITQAQST